MKIDLTAAARVLLLNCADVGRVRIAKHTRQADGGIAAGVRADVQLSKAKSTKCSRSRNTSSPVTYCFRRAAISSVPMASRHSTNTSPSFGACRTQTTSLPPPLILPPAGEGRVGATDPGGQCCGSGPFATTAGGTAGAQQPPVASSPSRPGIEEDAVAILQVWDDRGGAADDRPTRWAFEFWLKV